MPSSVYSLYNYAAPSLVQAQNLIVLTNGILQSQSQSPIDPNFTTAFTSTSQLTLAISEEIASDIGASANTSSLEFGTCVSGYLTAHNEQPTPTNVQAGSTYCQATPSAMSAAVTEFTGTIQPGIASAGQLAQLLDNLGGVTGSTLNSADTASVSSSGTVTAVGSPVAYNITINAASGGYFLPAAWSMLIPSQLTVNTALIGAEVNAAANGSTPQDIAAVESNPPASATSIGTVTLTSPLADSYGASNNQLVGKIYVVQTGANSGQGSITQPYLELWFEAGIYTLGQFPNSLAPPIPLNFGLAVTPIGNAPLPTSSLSMSFPAATSPVKATSCTDLGTVNASVTDDVANLALEFGDTSDGLTSPSGTVSAVNLASTKTAVTNDCATTAAPKPKPKSTLTGSASGLTSGHPTVTLHVKAVSAFGSETVGLPGGLKFVKSKTLAKEVSVSGAKVKSVKIAGGKLVITLKSKVKSDTISTKKGLISESSALIKSIKKHKTKKLSFTVRAGSASIKASVKA